MRHNNRQQYMHCVCKLCGIQSQQAHSLKIVKKVRDPKKSAPFRRLIKATVVENHRKSRIQYCEQSELRLHFDKSSLKMPKNGPIWRDFENLKFWVKQCYQTGQF